MPDRHYYGVVVTPRDDAVGSAGILSAHYLPTTVGAFALVALVAFESLAVTTIMPTIARDLDGLDLYALAFAAPLASGVIAMVVTGAWSDRSGPVPPLLATLAGFCIGLLVCAAAPTMPIFALGRVAQGLGGGGLIVVVYVMVGKVYPPPLQPSIFASFAAAWVLPALFGPALAALVAESFGWPWVFSGTVVLVLTALLLLIAPLRTLPPHAPDPDAVAPSTLGRLVWAAVAGLAVLALTPLGTNTHGTGLLAVAGVLLVALLALARLLPEGTLRLARGLPAVVATRGVLGAVFLCAEAYIVYALQDHWQLTPTHAGVALTGVGIVWALASALQARIGLRLSHAAVMTIGGATVLAGLAGVTASLLAHDAGLAVPWAAPLTAYVVAGGGMGFAYPRTGVSVLSHSTESDRGRNSSALSIADSMGAAMVLSVAGVAFGLSERAGLDPFLVVFALATALGLAGIAAARRTPVAAVAP